MSTTITSSSLRRISASPLTKPCTASTTIFVRHESSARRMTKKLRLHPHDSFVADTTGEANAPQHTHIIYNPPASAPTPNHTPRMFLPADDPRQHLAIPSSLLPLSSSSAAARLPPPLSPVRAKTYHLNQEQMERMAKLREKDPKVWTRKKLAEKFGCSEFFAGMVAPAPEARKEEEWAKLDMVKQKWGPRRKLAREERTTRREMWGTDEF